MHVLTVQIAFSDFSANQSHDGACVWNVRISRPGLPIQASDWVFLHQLETAFNDICWNYASAVAAFNSAERTPCRYNFSQLDGSKTLPRSMPATSVQDLASASQSLFKIQ